VVTTAKQNLIVFLATGGLIGFSPVAPGTFGSLAALPFCLLVSKMRIETALIVVLVVIAVSTWVADSAEKISNRKDPQLVVIDEICGMLVALFALPFTPGFVVAGFFLFRLFDIYKPFPIRWFDRNVAGGPGIMLDDVVAGLFTNGLLHLTSYI
jgi:phosphatidylglycerophosphatase A